MSDADTLIHVSFSPSGVVVEIGERPAAATPQQWFDHLTERVGASYRPLSGGRGVFRLARGDVARLGEAFSGA